MPPSWTPFKTPTQNRNLTLLPQRLTFYGNAFWTAGQSKPSCVCYEVCLNTPFPRSLICVAMQALFIQGPICLCVPTYSLSISGSEFQSTTKLSARLSCQHANTVLQFQYICETAASFTVWYVEHIDTLTLLRCCLIRTKRQPEGEQGRKAESISVCVFTRVHLSKFNSYSLMYVALKEGTCLI